MDVDETGRLVSLDPDMLQLQEVSPLSLKSSLHVAEELYSQWLSLPDTCRLVHKYIVDLNCVSYTSFLRMGAFGYLFD